MKLRYYGEVRTDDYAPLLWVDDCPRFVRKSFTDGWTAVAYAYRLVARYKKMYIPLNT